MTRKPLKQFWRNLMFLMSLPTRWSSKRWRNGALQTVVCNLLKAPSWLQFLNLKVQLGQLCLAVAPTGHQLLAQVVSAPACSQSPKAVKYLCAVSARICWHHAFPSWSPCAAANALLAKSASSFSTSHRMLATLALRLILRFSNRFTTRSQQCVMVDIRSLCRRRLMRCVIQ